MPTDSLTICNAALTRTGNDVISSLDDANARAKTLNANYDVVVRTELGKHRWNWATKYSAIEKLVETPPDQWSYVYQLPDDLLQLRTITQAGEVIEYTVMGEKVYTLIDNSESDLIAVYGAYPDESEWPPWFVGPVVTRLEAVLLRAIGERHAEAKERDGEADVGFATARRLDSQAQTPRDPHTYPIIAARNA